jgi:predicted RNA-binding protein YlxR (DUF448 family)
MPERTCLGCRRVREKSALLRFAVVENRLMPDIKGRFGSRGVYLCPVKSCFEDAYKLNGSFKRAFKRDLSLPDLEELLADLGALVAGNLK